MTVTITFPKLLSNRLQQEARRLQIPVEELATNLLSEALLKEPFDLPAPAEDEGLPGLEEIVARIKQLPRDPESFHAGEKANDPEYLAWLLANPPKDTLTFEEWEQFWPQFEQELKAIDRADDIREGRP
jgi:hypothetical protein